MSNITIQHITPRHFYEAVKLLKQTDHHIRFSYDTVEIRFVFDRLETAEQTQARFEQMEHLGEFLKELTNSPVPVDLNDFVRKYRYQSKRDFLIGVDLAVYFDDFKDRWF
ncbi:hypothetical protein [Rodentibacter pneumotropicus]|uniref:hypothetical protein n=1 Tax=Rodentibacter pneumotropicus TaxID=758 RepID=UPI001362AB85|nr:hypothetical protein [Rodentibacter pneumotropicus]NBH74727.1 hypothetical protein [Rodentibacter pneumotropicus]